MPSATSTDARPDRIRTRPGRESPAERVHGSVAAALIAVQRGAILVRVHDVAATKDALAVWAAVGPEAPAKSAPAKPKISLFDDD